MNILALDTSSSWGSVAVSSKGGLTCISYLNIEATHSERLILQIDNCLQQARMKLDDINLIVYSNGPGSFTGLRIGLATVKGICTAKEIPLYPVNTLYALAYNLYGCQCDIVPFIDAKMNEIYAAVYDKDFNEKIAPQNNKPDIFLEKLSSPAIIVGDGVEKYSPYIDKCKQIVARGLAHQNMVIASALIGLSFHKGIILKYDFEAIADLEPYYLRKSQAELNKANTGTAKR